MKDEIKEIIDYLKIENGTIGSELSYEETHLLLDYITNLQEENEILKIEKQEEYNRFNLMSKFRDKALARELMYKSRIDKVIEYITNLQSSDYELQRDFNQNIDFGIYETDNILNILNGDDEE